LPFLSGDILEGVVESVTAESDRINQNLKSVDIDKLKLFRTHLFTLRYKLMTKVEKLETEVELLRGSKRYEQIGYLLTFINDINYELIPLNKEIKEITDAIDTREVH